MSVSTCPVATIHAPAERVWHLLSQPDSYALWWDAHTLSITPEGPAKPGQQVRAQAAALGRWWPIGIRVEMVDESKRQIRLKTALPFGITVHNHISCVLLNETNCQVSFG
jgi:hypothetical protein